MKEIIIAEGEVELDDKTYDIWIANKLIDSFLLTEIEYNAAIGIRYYF